MIGTVQVLKALSRLSAGSLKALLTSVRVCDRYSLRGTAAISAN